MPWSSGENNNRWSVVLEVGFLLVAVLVGYQIVQMDFGLAVPLLLALVGFVLVRYVMNRPFHQAFAIYMALAAFNYYYFYCSKLTGRNPTDVGEWGVPAKPLEKMQKDIVFFLLLALGGVKLLKSRLEGSGFWSRKLDHPLLKLTALSIGFTLFRAIFWLIQGDSTFDTLFYLRTNIEYAVLPFLLCTALITKEKHLRIILKGVIYTLPIVAILGIVEFLIQGSPYERSFYGGQVFSRATATLQNPNNLGGYLATAMGVYILCFFKNQLTSFERWLFWPTMPLGFACLFMTLSRSSILFFFVTLTLCFAMLYFTVRQEMGRENFRICRNLMVTYVLTLGVSTFVLYRYFDFGNAFTDGVEMYVQSTGVSNTRLYAPLVTINALLKEPLAAFFGYSQSVYDVLSDNVFANLLIRNGVIGFLIYIGIWLKALGDSFVGAVKIRGNQNYLYIVSFYILCFQALYGFTAPINENFPHNMYFWYIVGVLVWISSKPAKADVTPERIQPVHAQAQVPSSLSG